MVEAPTPSPTPQPPQHPQQRQPKEQQLFMSWDSFVVMLPFLPTVKPVRLLSKAHRSTADGFLLVERGKVPLYPPLGFQTEKYLDGQDVYTLFRFGEGAWNADRMKGRDEYKLLSKSLRTQLEKRAEGWNKMKEVDLDVDQLHPIPDDFVPDKKLNAFDVYVLRKYGTEAWRAASYKYREKSQFLSQRAKSCLLDEAQRVNDRHATRTLPGFSPDCELEAYDVYVIRKHGAHNFNTPESSSWWDAEKKHAKPQRMGEYNRLTSDLQHELYKEAKAVSKRFTDSQAQSPSAATPTPLPPALPSSFQTNKHLTAEIVYVIRKLGGSVWRSDKYNNWSLCLEYYRLASADKQVLEKEAEEWNKRNEITAQSLASKYTITTEGVVQERGPAPKKQMIKYHYSSSSSSSSESTTTSTFADSPPQSEDEEEEEDEEEDGGDRQLEDEPDLDQEEDPCLIQLEDSSSSSSSSGSATTSTLADLPRQSEDEEEEEDEEEDGGDRQLGDEPDLDQEEDPCLIQLEDSSSSSSSGSVATSTLADSPSQSVDEDEDGGGRQSEDEPDLDQEEDPCLIQLKDCQNTAESTRLASTRSIGFLLLVPLVVASVVSGVMYGRKRWHG